MTPLDLLNAVLHERGQEPAEALPVRIRFGHTPTAAFFAPTPRHAAVECALDSLVLGSSPLLKQKLLLWNSLPSSVGSLGLGRDEETILYRMVFPCAGCGVDEFKEALHDFLNRAADLEERLLNNPLDLDLEPDAEPVSGSASDEPASTAHLISV